MSELTFESVLIQVRDALQRNRIQLWKEPYYLNTTPNESEMLDLANSFSETLNIKYDYCLAALNELQNHSLDKLRSNEEFKSRGLASLKVRIPCKKSAGGVKHQSFKIQLTEVTQNLIKQIAQKMEAPCNHIKLISNGKLLSSEKTLAEQGVKNFQQMMALDMKVDQDEAKTENESYDRVQKIRKDAELLIRSGKNHYFNLENQNGEAIHLPESERSSLMISLLLYEKGRAQMKKENHNEALILFLESDQEIKSCDSSILKIIDNIALLNLDIVWCYLQLKSIAQLPDAEKRLQICEENFKRTYGENFERLRSLKSSDMSERCLVLRLKLLKAVVCFYQNKRSEASIYLSMAEEELSNLKINDEKLSMLIEMGYTHNEAIFGLRSTYNSSIDTVINYILERRQKLAEARKVGRKERYLGNFLENLGFNVNPKDVDKLTEMGFEREISAMALQKSNNDLIEAIRLLQTQSKELKTEMTNFIKPDEKLVDKLKTLGFDEALIISILKSNINNFDTTLDTLLKMQNNENLRESSELFNKLNEGTMNFEASTSSNDANKNDSAKKQKLINLSANDEKALFDDLRNDLDHLDEDDEYLTFTLEKEQELLNQYKRALGS